MSAKLERITIRITKELKMELERNNDKDWYEIIRQYLKTELSKSEILKKIQNLLEEYKNDPTNGEFLIRALYMYVVIGNDNLEYTKTTLKQMFPTKDTLDLLVDEMYSNLKNNGIEKLYLPTPSNMTIKEAFFLIFDQMGITYKYQNQLQQQLKSTSEEVKTAVWLLSQYIYQNYTLEEYDKYHFKPLIIPTGFERTLAYLFGNNTKITNDDFAESVADKLVEFGLLYDSYYSSNAYGYSEFVIPPYAQFILEEWFNISLDRNSSVDDIYLLNPCFKRTYIKQKFADLFKNDDRNIKTILKWLDRPLEMVSEYQEEEEIQKKLGIQNYASIIQTLIQNGIILIEYFPYRSRAGKRSSEPARFYYRYTPVARESLKDVLLDEFLQDS